MQTSSQTFDAYARNLRRIMWAEFLDQRMKASRARRFRASLVECPYLAEDAPDAPCAAGGHDTTAAKRTRR